MERCSFASQGMQSQALFLSQWPVLHSRLPVAWSACPWGKRSWKGVEQVPNTESRFRGDISSSCLIRLSPISCFRRHIAGVTELTRSLRRIPFTDHQRGIPGVTVPLRLSQARRDDEDRGAEIGMH
jgi:hypothetical protein